MKKLLLVFITGFNILFVNVSFSASKDIALPELPLMGELESQFSRISEAIEQEFEQAKKTVDLQFANFDEILNELYNLEKDQVILYSGKEWIVVAIQENKGFKTIQLDRFPKPTAPLKREMLLVEVKKANPKMYEIKQDTKLTFLGKVALGAFAVGIGGAFLAATYAPDYFNTLYEKASPWLDSLRVQFQSALGRFKSYYQSK